MDPTGRRIAIVCPNLHPRTCGVGDHSVRLGAELRRRGYEVALFSRAPAQPHPEAPELPVYGAPGRLPILIARQIADAILAGSFTDAVIQYTAQMWDAWRFGSPAVVWLARRLRRAGLQVTLIAHELHLAWQHRPDLLAASALQRLQLGALLRTCDRALVTTETRARAVALLARLAGKPTPGVLRVGPNALPADAARPRGSNGAATPHARLGVFTTAAVGKHLDVVLDAFARVAARIPAAELALIGDLGPADHPRVREVTDAVARHPARARIRLTGKLPLREVSAEIARLDVYLFPMETGANTRSGTLPVALGSGLPVVAVAGRETDAGLFRDGDNIVLAPALDGAAFAEATLRLLDDPALAARVGEGARRLYRDELCWERIADRLIAELGPPPAPSPPARPAAASARW
jgi:glycosyltransferase involved in cell wall biosynthesis